MREKSSRNTADSIDPKRLVLPLFIGQERDQMHPSPGISGVYHLGIERALDYARGATELGVREFLVFGTASTARDNEASAASDPNSPVCTAIRELSRSFPECRFWGHVTLAHYTEHGGNCCVGNNGEIDWELTTDRFCKICATLATSGAGIVLPFLLRPGAISSIRSYLQSNGLEDTAVFSYGAKFRSSLYGPFNRSTGITESSFGDLQLEPWDREGAMEKIRRDVSEGSEGLVVKPALFYLDVILSARSSTELPLVAYMVSGEYMMLRHAAATGIAEGRASMLEAHTSILRAGADLVISYDALDLLKGAQ